MGGVVHLSLILVLYSFGVATVSAAKHHKLIVVLIDGFRWNYLDDPQFKNLKGFAGIIKNGVKAEYLEPVFPTLTYPNMNSFATGLYPESHGFVDNMLWDKKSNTFFEMIPAMNSSDPRWWQQAEPIWITAQKNNLKTALYWWQGCEVKIHGYHPQICERHIYDPPSDERKRDMIQRVDDIVEMFKPSTILSYDRLDLAMLYYSGVDWAGHYASQDSPVFRKAVQIIDDVLDYLQKALARAKLTNQVNIMVLSDHGMADVRNTTFITLDKYSQYIRYQVNAGPIISLVPQPGKEEKLYYELVHENITGLHVYRRQDIPESFHTKNAKRLGPIVLECDEAYFVKALNDTSKLIGDIQFSDYYGEHGYSPNATEDMRAIFMATGPDFRSGLKTKPIQVIDLYNVMCHILGLQALPNNGTWKHVQPMLRTLSDGPYYSHASTFTACIALIVSFAIIFTVKNALFM
ncbi:glycerophosphocholine cholinephosphodiesterase ENPP6-like [Argiope bruennichi]|uniref:glycerophosphocholine cholinephosphodiesterase ENPP6-like n=1 Tax=Argiope bruennichi TaxID=94029 RepID=UPI0024948A3E|nr:glycerophosphocholine cholinephosphodiesterase ENPP6-like [Argiope bruennichi]